MNLVLMLVSYFLLRVDLAIIAGPGIKNLCIKRLYITPNQEDVFLWW